MSTPQGVRAVVTLNEDFEVFISTEQYKVGQSYRRFPKALSVTPPSPEPASSLVRDSVGVKGMRT